jgi:hypothetical protein
MAACQGAEQAPGTLSVGIGYQQVKASRAIPRCHTSALGGHIDVHRGCGFKTGIAHNSYHSHC